jgi:deoxyribose-phosphate aldolase
MDSEYPYIFDKSRKDTRMTHLPSLYQLAKMIDHSLLHPTMTDAEILAGCEIACRYDVATVCVKPYAVTMSKAVLQGSSVEVCSVIGFPHGNHTTVIKVAEAGQAIHDGASEIDMVINIGKALGGDWDFVAADVDAVNQACSREGALLKVIFETDYLQDAHIIKLCQLCSELKVAYVKTSSGYGFVKQPGGDYNYKGATDHVLTLMRQHSAPEVQVKAAGGVRTLDDLLRVRALGVTRIGATATSTILDTARERGII